VETFHYESHDNSVRKHEMRIKRKFKVKLDGQVVEIKDGVEQPVEHDALDGRLNRVISEIQAN